MTQEQPSKETQICSKQFPAFSLNISHFHPLLPKTEKTQINLQGLSSLSFSPQGQQIQEMNKPAIYEKEKTKKQTSKITKI